MNIRGFIIPRMNRDECCPQCHGDGWIPCGDGEEASCPLCNTMDPPDLPSDFKSVVAPRDDDEDGEKAD